MQTINEHHFFAVFQIKSIFENDIEGEDVLNGTGFFVIKDKDSESVFITCKHLVDPALKYPDNSEWRVKSIEVMQRKWDLNTKKMQSEVVSTKIEPDEIIMSSDSDCAILRSDQFQEEATETMGASHLNIQTEELASDEFLLNNHRYKHQTRPYTDNKDTRRIPWNPAEEIENAYLHHSIIFFVDPVEFLDKFVKVLKLFQRWSYNWAKLNVFLNDKK